MGVLVGSFPAFSFLGLVVGMALLLVRRASFLVSCIVIVGHHLLFLEVGQLTLSLNHWDLICGMRLVIVVPTTVLELSQNDSLYDSKCDSVNCLLLLDIIGHNMIPFVGDCIQQHHPLNVLRYHYLVCPKALQVGVKGHHILCRIGHSNLHGHCSLEVLVYWGDASWCKLHLEVGPSLGSSGTNNASAHILHQVESYLPIADLILQVPCIQLPLVRGSRHHGKSRTGPGPIGNTPQALGLKEGCHLGLPSPEVGAVKDGNMFLNLWSVRIAPTARSWAMNKIVTHMNNLSIGHSQGIKPQTVAPIVRTCI